MQDYQLVDDRRPHQTRLSENSSELRSQRLFSASTVKSLRASAGDITLLLRRGR